MRQHGGRSHHQRPRPTPFAQSQPRRQDAQANRDLMAPGYLECPLRPRRGNRVQEDAHQGSPHAGNLSAEQTQQSQGAQPQDEAERLERRIRRTERREQHSGKVGLCSGAGPVVDSIRINRVLAVVENVQRHDAFDRLIAAGKRLARNKQPELEGHTQQHEEQGHDEQGVARDPAAL